MVKAFGCRPVVTYLRALRVGVRKPPRKDPAGAGRQCRLWGFDDAGACVVDALAGVIGGGSMRSLYSGHVAAGVAASPPCRPDGHLAVLSKYRSSVPLSELTTRESRVDGIVKFLCVERFPQELEVIFCGVLHRVVASGNHYHRKTDFL
jgi:hypothetical protein